jgi:LmbE family N-acetylglucosaminyl deacetylase
MKNPYHLMVSRFSRLLREGLSFPLGGFDPCPQKAIPGGAPKVLLFSPHPDDECLTGGLALRFLREMRMNVINVAVTQGTLKERQTERLGELRGACDYLGYGLIQTAENGLDQIDVRTRRRDQKAWSASVNVIKKILAENQPAAIFLPHAGDWHPTHIGTHYLVLDALMESPGGFSCLVLETEFWRPMRRPNLLVKSSPTDVGDLVTALSFHKGEVRRNPYHILLPSWMADNVRRGCEIIAGRGAVSPGFLFATLYRMRKYEGHKFLAPPGGGRILSLKDDLGELFRCAA